MERLTFEGNFCDIARCESVPGGSYCESGSCSQREVWERLKAYEDTGLTPEEIYDLVSVREISPEAEYAINKHADSIIERLDKLLAQTDDDDRLRELAEADKEGRVVVLPCKVGDTVYFAADFNLRDSDKTVFLTREEAEEALRSAENG